jgi:hypothetical protein
VTHDRFILACAAAIALIAAAYANSLHNSFHFDDSHVIESNVYIRSLHNVPLFFRDAHTFSSLPQNATYRPLVTLSLALDYARGALDPHPYHVTQIVLLIATGVLLVVFFIPMIGEWPALFAATLFCIHTANTETMNLISARSELLSTVGLLGSFVLFQRSPFARRTWLYLIPLAVGALAKAPLVVFAPLLFAYVWFFEDKRRVWRESVPPLVLGIGLLAFLNSMNAPEWQSGGGSAYHYLITQPFIWLHYFRLFFLPIGLTADTDMPVFDHWYDTRAIAGYAFLALFVFAIRRVENRAVKFGLVWFAVALIPTSIFPLAEVANEHRIFFAYIGLVLALAALIPRNALPVVAIVVLGAHLVGTHERNKVWRSEETLWADVVVKSPGNGRAWMNYGLTKMAHGQYAEAKSSFERAATLTPNYWILEINRGIVEGELGDQAAAEGHFKRALDLNADANAHFFYARWLVQRGRAPEALPHLRAALRISSAFAEARALLLRLDAAADDAELRRLVGETLRIDPADPALADVSRTWATSEAALAACNDAARRADWLAAAYACRSAGAGGEWTLALQKLGFR